MINALNHYIYIKLRSDILRNSLQFCYLTFFFFFITYYNKYHILFIIIQSNISFKHLNFLLLVINVNNELIKKLIIHLKYIIQFLNKTLIDIFRFSMLTKFEL